MELDFKTLDVPTIARWCLENGQVEWLKEANAPKPTPTYPMEEYTKKDGTIGKRANKKAEPLKVEMKTPSTVELKSLFMQKFFPDLAPTAGTKAPTKDELIAALGTPAYPALEKKYLEAQAKAKASKAKA